MVRTIHTRADGTKYRTWDHDNKKPRVNSDTYQRAYDASMQRAYDRYGEHKVNTTPRLYKACVLCAKSDAQTNVDLKVR